MIRDVVVRTAGERTADVCVARLELLFPFATIHRLRLAPFTAALKECWRIMRESEGEWCLSCDGDVLPDDRVLDFTDELRNYTSEGMVNASISDWLFGLNRPGGIRAYRPSCVPTRVRNIRRPESLSLRRAGVLCTTNEIVIGTHDKEQWLNDVYHKVMHHAWKHSRNGKYMNILGRQKKRRDHEDFIVMDAALKDRLEFRYMDSRCWPSAPLERLGLTEKEPLIC